MPSAFMNVLICAFAAVRLAPSPWRITFTVTSPAIRPMITITTSISIRVTPRSDLLRLFVIWLVLYCYVVDACDRQHQAHNHAAYHQTHHQNDERLKQR